MAVVALVAVGGARRDEIAHRAARQQLDPRAFEVFDDPVGNADVGNDHIAGVGLGGRQNQRELGSRERHRQRRFDRWSNRLVRIG